MRTSDLDFLYAAEVHELAVLQDTQQFRLRVKAHGADFVEEQRATVGHFEQAFFRSDSGREGSLDMAE